MDKLTMVQIYQSTAKKLKMYKLTKAETYDEIINRLLEHINNDNHFKKFEDEE